MRKGFAALNAEYQPPKGTVAYSDYLKARLLYEATRAAAFWASASGFACRVYS
jgi:hypothetical protein